MTAKKNSLKDFTVYATVTVSTTTTVRAANLVEATEQASCLEINDFVTLGGTFMDSEPILVTGIYLNQD